MMIEFLEQWRKRFFHIEEIDDESCLRIGRAVQHHLYPVGMTMHPMTAMGLRNMGKPVRSLECECLGYFHRIPRCLWT